MFILRILLIVFLFLQCKNTDKNKIISLNGEWDYRLGFDIDWLSNPRKDPSWKKISLPTNLTKELDLTSYTGYITLKRDLPDSMNSYLKNGKPLVINVGRVLDVFYFYFNKILIGQLGSFSPY